MISYKFIFAVLMTIFCARCCIAANGSSHILVKAIRLGDYIYIDDFSGDEQSLCKASTDGSGTIKKLRLPQAVETSGDKLVSSFDIKDSHLYYTSCPLWRPLNRSIELFKFLMDDFDALTSGTPHAPYKELLPNQYGINIFSQIDLIPLIRTANAMDKQGKEPSFTYDFVVLPSGHIKLFTLVNDKMIIGEYEVASWNKGSNAINEQNSVTMTAPFRGAFHAISDNAGNCFLVAESGAIHTVSNSAITEISRLNTSAIASNKTRAGIILLKDATSGSMQVVGSANLFSSSPSAKLLHTVSATDSNLQSSALNALKSVLPAISPP